MTRWIGITLGDVTGIGPEVTLKALAAEPANDDTRYLLIGDEGYVHRLNEKLGTRLPLEKFSSYQAAGRIFTTRPFAEPLPENLPAGSPAAANAAVAALKNGAKRCLRGELDAVVTAPVNKEAIVRAGHKFVGQTELFAKAAKTKRYAMMLLGHDEHDRWLRVALVTIHTSIKSVPRKITPEKITLAIELAAQACRDLGLPRAKIAVCGLNPHAGEGGEFGDEEIKTITPTVSGRAKKRTGCRRPVERRHGFLLCPARRFRRGGGDVSRPGTRAVESRRLRHRHQLDARPAVHPHLARPRHGLRHCGKGNCQSVVHDCRHPAGEAVGEKS